MANLSKQQAESMAYLAALPAPTQKSFTNQLTSLLEHFKKVGDQRDAKEFNSLRDTTLYQSLREDVSHDSLSSQAVLQLAPRANESHIVAQPIK